ncbi:hypothetical protein ACFLR3_01730 [Campylobacterota bacterium]
MKSYVLIFVLLVYLMTQVYSEEQVPNPSQKIEENKHPRLSDLDPKAWKGLPLEVVVSDFQVSDGIFSSFICDEFNKRLSTDPSGSLDKLNKIDKKSRIYLFKICLSPEGDDPSAVLKAIHAFTGEYPDLVKEITDATKW